MFNDRFVLKSWFFIVKTATLKSTSTFNADRICFLLSLELKILFHINKLKYKKIKSIKACFDNSPCSDLMKNQIVLHAFS